MKPDDKIIRIEFRDQHGAPFQPHEVTLFDNKAQELVIFFNGKSIVIFGH